MVASGRNFFLSHGLTELFSAKSIEIQINVEVIVFALMSGRSGSSNLLYFLVD
jgi:hypothetical protein